MIKFCIFIGSTVVGWAGWWLGDQLGGMTPALILSSAGSIAGAYAGWRIARDYL